MITLLPDPEITDNVSTVRHGDGLVPREPHLGVTGAGADGVHLDPVPRPAPV